MAIVQDGGAPMAGEMLAARYQGPRQVALERVPRPEPGPGEVRVRVQAAGICGSDLHWYRAEWAQQPTTPGHEVAGTVEALGPGVEGLALGQAVCVEPLRRCGECPPCRMGAYNHCRRFTLYGAGLDGGMAEFEVVPAYAVWPLPTDVPLRLGSLVEPLAVAVHGIRSAADSIAAWSSGVPPASIPSAEAAGDKRTPGDTPPGDPDKPPPYTINSPASASIPPSLGGEDAPHPDPTLRARGEGNEVGVRGALAAGTEVLVIGGGTLGLAATLAAVDAGARVTLVARYPHQQAVASAFGAERVLASADEATHAASNLVVDAVGTEESLARAVAATGELGTVLLLSDFGSRVAFDLSPFFLKGLRLVAALCYCDHGGDPDFPRAARLLAGRLDQAAHLVTHRFPLARVADAYATADDKRSASIKVIVEP